MNRVHEPWGWYSLLLLPFVGTLAVPIYLRTEPELFGFPFFYWYQFAWIPLGAIVTGVVYYATTDKSPPPSGGANEKP